MLVENVPLIRCLLDHGALPSTKNSLALEIAITRKRLTLVKLLVESAPRASPKRRRVEDRMRITPLLLDLAMKKGADDIVNYFMREKGESEWSRADIGVMPPLKAIMKLHRHDIYV